MKKSVWESQVIPFCPGISQGKLFTAQEIERIIRQEKETFHVDISNVM